MIVTKIIGAVPLADGDYEAFWGGYEVRLRQDAYITVAGERMGPCTVLFKTDQGIRTMAAPAVVTVKAGRATVRTKDHDERKPAA